MKLTFNGGAREVGGSCTVVDTRDARVALDYGMKVDEGLSNELPEDLDATVVTHAHLDHSGNLLTLVDKGIVTIGSAATRDITLELLRDVLKIHRLKGKPVPYTFKDVSRLSELWIDRKNVALPGLEIGLHHAGHVLGASMVEVRGEDKTVLYTGDFCTHDTEIIDGADIDELPREPDALIMESTYGGTIRPQRKRLVKELLGKITNTMERKGNILLPTFAFHRMQEMARRIDLAMKNKILPRYNAYYISGLAHRITRHYNHYKSLLSEEVNHHHTPFNYKCVRRLRRTEQIKEPAVVICTSGFGHAGASHFLLHQWAENNDDSIIINTGYLPTNSPLLMAKEGRIVNNGQSLKVEADVEQIELSGHADQRELTEFVKILRPKETFLVHGTIDEAQALQRRIEEYTDVHIPHKNEDFRI